MLKKKTYILFIFIYFFCFGKALAIDTEVFVQSTVNRASKLLSEEISKDEKVKELKKIARDTVDIKGIGFYTLGPIRKSLNENDIKKYSDLFEEYFLRSC